MKFSTDAVTLRRFFAFSSAFVDAARIYIADGLNVRAVDSGNVCLTSVKSPKTAFDVFEVGREKEFGVDLKKTSSFLKRLMGVVNVEIDKNIMSLSTENLSYSTKLIDVEHLKPQAKMPELNFTAKAETSGDEFRNAIAIASRVSSHVIFENGLEGLTMKAGDGSNSLTYSFYESEGEAKTAVSCEYLKSISKILAKTDIVAILAGKDIPLKIAIEPEQRLEVAYYIAPRIEVR